jgi:ribosome-binding protein aMBF1 (putative translation factor)
MKHSCPVCGFPNLTEPPRAKNGGASFEICPSCGFQFGVSDDDKKISYAEWRATWSQGGSQWSSRQPAPKNWDAATKSKHLRALERAKK